MRFTAPRRTFCVILSIALLCAIGISILGVLTFSPNSAEVRDPNQAGSLLLTAALMCVST